MKKISLVILFSLSVNIFSPAFSKEIQVKDETVFINLKRQIETAENKKLNLELIDLYKNNGQDDKAIELARSILNHQPRNHAVIFKLAELLYRNFYFDEAENYLKTLPRASMDYNNAVIALMELYINKKDKEKAQELLKNNPDNLLLSAIYDYSAFSLDPKSASEKLEKILKSEPQNKKALFYLSSILIDNHKLAEARQNLKNVISQDYFFSRAHALLGYLEAIDSKKDGTGAEELKIALRTNPMESRALISYGNGTTNTNYDELERNNPNLQSSEYFFSKNREIINLLNQNKKTEAEKILNEIITKYPENIHSYLSKGNYYINIQEYRNAIDTYKKARNISPDYGLANNGLSVAIKLLASSQEKKLKTFNLDIYDYSGLDIESIKKVFINYNDLPQRYQKVIFYSVYPVRSYLPVLAASGSTHYIIPLYEKSTDYKFGRELKNQRSFDGRLWDDIRGRGGFNSATGIEDLETSINFDFNTLTHEFAHQVHGYALSKTQQAKIYELYDKAKKDNKFLDYYAGSNAYEYFAQGVEAYNSRQGKLTLKSTAKNTIELLKNKDIDLYNFIEKVANDKISADNYSEAYLQAASDAYFNNDYQKTIYSYEKAVEVKPGDINNYLLLANTYYQAGQINKSIDTYNKVLSSDKTSSYAQFGLAYNYLITGKFNEAQNSFESGFVKEKLSADAYAETARLFIEKNDYKNAQEYLDKAFKVEADNALAYSVKALLNSEKFNIEEAVKNIDQAIKLDPGNNLYKIRKAGILTKSGAVINAYKELQGIEDIYKNSLPVRYEYDDKKKKYYYFNIKDTPTMAEYYYTLGVLKESEKNYNEAVNNYFKSMDLINDYYKPKKKLFELLSLNGLDKDTKSKIESILKK